MRGYYGDNEDFDDMSKWEGVEVEGVRVTELCRHRQGLSCTIPAEIGSLLALSYLALTRTV